ncbi:phospho-sugar mutase [Corynebacterium sp. 320]|nr:phospho-sugar mutase [Corynebacterium sp. 320]KAB1553368.1 phospho-sugar mutase [Corynebacterium sp. 321]KAB1554521.1 phospho-sugar mutase [Corynebacterium sp. 319]KAB3528707.1 phospho-sugar mutase [Corynebacterium sp. 250]KAB3540856.1 phospho-sugar mutase [Corynebacterium sp. 366]QNP93275.1 phospho-sugar mutase [Corynebacterium zhongnanshanii]
MRFGTAGLRASVGPGPDQMNVSTVTRATAGVASWLGDNKRVAVGYDARYGSSSMALATAQVFAGAGYEVTLIGEPAPTPVLAWLVRDRGLDAGVQITASHNPAGDNGYKLYLAGGSQLISPADREIEEHIARQPAAPEIPRVDVISVDKSVVTGYVNALCSKVANGNLDKAQLRRDLRIAYTPMHGVGGSTLEAALRQAGFSDIHAVTQQRWPDPEFPTVDFPNPEEPGATDLLLELGKQCDADLLIALDPDADRCAVGIPRRMFRGDQTGPLLAAHVLEEYVHADAEAAPVVATTVVSSQLLSVLAEDRGWDYQETLTGFKYLSKAAEERPGELAFAYEEALGTCPFPDLVADKDGIATALVTAVWAAELKGQGRSLTDELSDLEATYGAFRTTQVSVRYDSAEQAAATAEEFRTQPPATLAGVELEAEQTDYGVKLTGRAGELHARVICRASGTEPKVKFYLEVHGPADQAQDVEALLEKLAAALR